MAKRRQQKKSPAQMRTTSIQISNENKDVLAQMANATGESKAYWLDVILSSFFATVPLDGIIIRHKKAVQTAKEELIKQIKQGLEDQKK
jgi:hypothetical protein